MLAETVPEPVHQEPEGVDRQSRLVELGWLLGEVQGRELEEPIAVVRDDVLRRGGGKVLGHLLQLLLGSPLLLAHRGRLGARRAGRGGIGLRVSRLTRRSRAGGCCRPGRGFARPRHAMFPFWCPQAAHPASVRPDN